MVIFLWRRINAGKDVLKLQTTGPSKCRQTKKNITRTRLLRWNVRELKTAAGRIDLSLYGYFSKADDVDFQLAIKFVS